MSRSATKRTPLRGRPKPDVNPYNNEKRYTHSAYRKRRAVFLNANPLCVHCSEKGLIEPATVLDHIQPVEQGGSFYDTDNWQSLCVTCHARKSNKDKVSKRSKGGQKV